LLKNLPENLFLPAVREGEFIRRNRPRATKTLLFYKAGLTPRGGMLKSAQEAARRGICAGKPPRK
jgi:hypothetical protein